MSGPYGYIGPQVMPPGMSGGHGGGPGGSGLDPSSNNQPLQFNTNKGKPPMPVMGGGEENRGDSEGPSSSNNSDMMQSNMMNQGMMGYGMMGPMGMGDPNMSMMGGPMGYGNQAHLRGQYIPPGTVDLESSTDDYQFQYNFMNAVENMMPTQKEIINFKCAVFYPPPPNAPHPTTRERPPGCRTVFVGGLPENCTEEMLSEIFESFGPICSIRLSKKNFAHIRYEQEISVDKALYVSGYRMKIDNKDEKENTGRLHVDYAQARDDLYEWECKQRSLARENRHRIRVEEERLRPPSPPPIMHYSDHEASVLMEHLKGDDSFMQASQVLMTWLDRGDCNRRTANSFYSMVQSINSHTRRLLNEKAALDQELEDVKLKFRLRHEGILRQFETIERVFSAAGKQKAWDHFSKAQRKNLDMWRKQAQEMLRMQQEEFLKDRQEAEMEMSDEEGDGPSSKKFKRSEETLLLEQNQWLLNQTKEENDQLKCQLEAYKNEVHLLKSENTDSVSSKDKQLEAIQKVLGGMQQQLVSAKQEMKQLQEKLAEKTAIAEALKSVSLNATPTVDLTKDKSEEEPKITSEEKKKDASEEESVSKEADTEASAKPTTSSPAKPLPVNQREAKLIGLICTFLHVHPFGASTEYIGSYLHRLDVSIRSSELEELLERLPSVFRQDYHGIGASIEKRWKFIGLDTYNKNA